MCDSLLDCLLGFSEMKGNELLPINRDQREGSCKRLRRNSLYGQ